MQTKIIDMIPKAIGILTSMLIFLGIISSVVYYRAFSINILEQISIEEALLLFVSKFSTLAIGTIFGMIVAQFFLIALPVAGETTIPRHGSPCFERISAVFTYSIDNYRRTHF